VELITILWGVKKDRGKLSVENITHTMGSLPEQVLYMYILKNLFPYVNAISHPSFSIL
jgi:hypothetical protein